ncbi:aminotransferase class V-fold PLP-dependent enzyme [Clostridium sp. 'deep sea']|uniref:aminotransferase class V-fold PLP-dependent enzyme n=1 Tax=Clostridium sp. 'deep sea' TaxID=2779445 RepID=UPI00189680AA|nr:aminotransferase class V-fold PLP-dependent enzyme [Clostridium sp. 'deep sea']QOR35205.1 aminotransferase class V-fold PLP-dependent enzyme [Clostridium sp. 'deep sea']
MRSLYLDNGATSFPKAPGVAESMSNYLLNVGCNINRGAYSASYEAQNLVFETRELICDLFNFNKPENVVFTKNVTESMNVLIKGLLKEEDHVLVSSMEHNAVMRPLKSLHSRNVDFTRIACNELGELNCDDIVNNIKPNTKAIIMTHASNVCGTIFNLKKVGSICKQKGLFFIIDSAQTAGFLDIDYQLLNADAIAFTGHKSLLGPQGTGGFIVNDKMVKAMSTLIEGGTGSLSELEVQPEYMPDKFEAGTLNIVGIYGLNVALKYLAKVGLKTIREKELYLTDLFLKGLSNMPNVKTVGKKSIVGRTAIVSVDFYKNDNGIITHQLNKEYGIMTRSGLHCAPSAHKTLGTFPNGTVRFGFSHFNTKTDIEYALDSISKILK